jgi:hypothetical protein
VHDPSLGRVFDFLWNIHRHIVGLFHDVWFRIKLLDAASSNVNFIPFTLYPSLPLTFEQHTVPETNYKKNSVSLTCSRSFLTLRAYDFESTLSFLTKEECEILL